MSEKLPTTKPNGWEQTGSGLLVPAEGTRTTYSTDTDVVVTDKRRINPHSVEEAQERARQPLEPQEKAAAAAIIASNMLNALNEFLERNGRLESTSGEGVRLNHAYRAAGLLGYMHEGYETMPMMPGESTENYIDRRIKECYDECQRRDSVSHPDSDELVPGGFGNSCHVSGMSNLSEFGRMRLLNDSFNKKPENVRAAILGEELVIKGSDDKSFQAAILDSISGRITYGDIRQAMAESDAA